jgi:phosphoglycerol transferase
MRSIKKIPDEWYKLYFIPLSCSLIFLGLVFRGFGYRPFIFKDEYIYSKSARLIDLIDSELPSYLYLMLYKLTNISGTSFLESARVINVFLFVLSLPFIYMVCRKVTSPKLSLFIAIFSILGPANTYTLYFMPEAMYYLAFWVFFWYTIGRFDLNNNYYTSLVGGILGIMSMIKAHAIFLLPSLAAFFLISHVLERNKISFKSIAIAISVSFLVFFVTRFTIGYLFAGEAGLSLFGKFYNDTAGSSISFGYLFQLGMDSLQSIKLHAMVLVALFGVPIALVCSFNYFHEELNEREHYQKRANIFLVSFLLPLLAITALFTTHVTGAGPYEVLGRLHMRYYNFLFPLMFIIAAGGIQPDQDNPSEKLKSWLISIPLIAITLYLSFSGMKDITAKFVDCPEWLGFVQNKTLFYALSAIATVSLVVWGFNKKRGSSFYIYIFVPLSVLVTTYNVNKTISEASTPSAYDRSGAFARDFLSAKTSKVIVAGSDLAGLFRTLFHIDSLNSEKVHLAPNAPLESSLINKAADWVLLIGDHPGLEDKYRIQLSDFTAIFVGNDKVVDFRKPLSMFIQIDGLSAQEAWGRWSAGDKVKIAFNSNSLPNKFKITIKASAFGPNENLDFMASLGQEVRKFRITGPEQTVNLDFTNPTHESTIIITIPQPTSPHELGLSADDRKLGIGLIELKIE